MCLVELGVGPAWQQAPQLVKVLLITDTDTDTGTDTDTDTDTHTAARIAPRQMTVLHTHTRTYCRSDLHTYILHIGDTHVHTAHQTHTRA
jgi:hypothetical protein